MRVVRMVRVRVVLVRVVVVAVYYAAVVGTNGSTRRRVWVVGMLVGSVAVLTTTMTVEFPTRPWPPPLLSASHSSLQQPAPSRQAQAVSLVHRKRTAP